MYPIYVVLCLCTQIEWEQLLSYNVYNQKSSVEGAQHQKWAWSSISRLNPSQCTFRIARNLPPLLVLVASLKQLSLQFLTEKLQNLYLFTWFLLSGASSAERCHWTLMMSHYFWTESGFHRLLVIVASNYFLPWGYGMDITWGYVHVLSNTVVQVHGL